MSHITLQPFSLQNARAREVLRTWLISLGVFSLVGLSSPSRTSWSVKVTRKRAEYRANQEQQRLQEGMSFAQRQQWYQQQQNMMRRNRQWVAAQRCVHPDLPLEKIRPPQFLMISCAKCGSTAFYFQGLCKHPKIKCRARHKEGNWFRTNYALHYHSAEEFYKAYTKESFQRLAPRVRHVNGTRVEEPVITLEASIWYYMYELAANNAAAAVPCAKLVWLLRNPLPHARSLYFHVLTDAPESLTVPGKGRRRVYTLTEVLQPEVEAMKRCHQKAGTSVTGGFSAPFMRCMEGENPRLPAVASPLKANLLRTGLYGFYIEGWRRRFPHGSMHFIDYEVLRTNAKSVLNGLMQFLNLEGPRSGAQAHDSRKVPFKEMHHGSINSRKARAEFADKEVLPPELLSSITQLLRPHVEAVYLATGENYGWNISTLQ